jgi:4,5-DOPA dioxygenase extradiol
MLALQNNAYTQFLAQLGSSLPKPKAVLIFSAHYEQPVLHYAYREQPYETIYDFYGFPEEMYSLVYPAKGSIETADRLQSLLAQAGIPAVKDTDRGLDHGAWVVLRLMYPQAEIPVVAASINRKLSPAQQYEIGKAVAGLKDEGVLVIASGGTSHNLRMIEWGAKEPNTWTVQFDDWLIANMERWDLDSLFAYETLAPHANLAVPPHGNEHFVPLFIAMGAGDRSRKTKLLHRSYDLGTLSLIAFQFE